MQKALRLPSLDDTECDRVALPLCLILKSFVPRNSSRWEFVREIYWRRGVFVVLIIYNGLQFISNLLAWTTSHETQQKYQFIKMAQNWALRTWLIGLLLLLLVITFEGAYRFIREQERSLGERIDQSETSIGSLKEELRPKLEIVFEPEHPFLFEDKPFRHDELRIGVKNVSGTELSRVRVQLDDVRYGKKVYKSLPLHVNRTKRLYEYPYQTEFLLNPGETEYLDLAIKLQDRSWGSFCYSGGAPDHINEDQVFDFTITAMANEGRPLRRRATISVTTSPPGFDFTLKRTDLKPKTVLDSPRSIR